ncbi:MAG TPA: hypothetical protein VFG09_04375 [Thermodesulfovibrionales bacterium]|jgi:flagellin-like hook-associated protein FlgL|nr:hypothetical protein [Thermodesulfovibrionales bacterium]
MAINDISLTAGMRANLVSLQGTVDLLNRTQQRLSTGKAVNSALDNPTAFFAAQALTGRASDLAALKDGMGQAVQSINAANSGITGITNLVEAAKGLAQSAYTSSDTSTLDTQYSDLMTQLDALAGDSGYQGTNLLNGDTLHVKFEGTTLDVSGTSSKSSDLGIDTESFASAGTIDKAISDLNAALGTLRTTSAGLSANLSVIQTRQDFTTSMINVLTTGSDSLTNADMNQEGANMLMLQTRQALGTTALSLSSQAAQSVLRLFG